MVIAHEDFASRNLPWLLDRLWIEGDITILRDGKPIGALTARLSPDAQEMLSYKPTLTPEEADAFARDIEDIRRWNQSNERLANGDEPEDDSKESQ